MKEASRNMSAAKKAKPAKKRAVATKPAKKARPGAKRVAATKPAKKARPATKKAVVSKPGKKAAVKKSKPARAAKLASKAKAPSAEAARPARKAAPAAPLVDGPPPAKIYMSVRQREWFRKKLEQMLVEIRNEVEDTAKEMREKEKGLADELDRAHNEFTFVVDLKENDRIVNLQLKIDHALRLIDTGTYGICDDCGIDIGLHRMVARPVATKCIDCKEFQEELERNVK